MQYATIISQIQIQIISVKAKPEIHKNNNPFKPKRWKNKEGGVQGRDGT